MILKGYRATAFFIIISHLPPGYPIISFEFKMAAVSVETSIEEVWYINDWRLKCVIHRWNTATAPHGPFPIPLIAQSFFR